MTDWRLRRAGPGDAAAAALVAGATFLEAFAGVLEAADIVAHVAAKSNADAFARWIDDPGSVVMLAEAASGGAPVGYSVLTAPDDLPVELYSDDIELKRIYVLAPFHGGGVGPALMARALADAAALGRGRVLLGVYGGNVRAQRFYAKQGFAVVGERRFRVGTTWHDDLVFARTV